MTDPGLWGGDHRAVEDAGRRVDECPKRMVYGPCGGVRADGQCEMTPAPCPFVSRSVVRWSGPVAARRPESVRERLGRRDGGPVIVTDLRVRPYDRGSIQEVTARLSAGSDAVLIGEHHDRPDFPPTLMAALVVEAGGRPWVTLTCRDRNRVVLESELEGLAAIGTAAVHCVTGDGRTASVRPDATQVFDLDSTRLAALAAQLGLLVSVAATPVAPPQDLRPRRLGEKVRAGARACFVNHAGGTEGVGRFVGAVRDAGIEVDVIPCVAVFTDAESVRVLERFPGLVLDPAATRAVLEAADGREAGIEAAVGEAGRMLAIEGVVGVNLSGAATSGSEHDSATIMAEVADRLRRRSAPEPSP
jgi:methylenetetrahydrofolate reductase (NADPH)